MFSEGAPYDGEPPINTALPFTESTLVRYGVEPIDPIKVMLATAHEAGVYTCADVMVMGTDLIRTHNSHGVLNTYETHLLRRAVRCVTGYDLQTERAPKSMWPSFYDDLRQASPAVLLPSSNPYYDHARLVATGLLQARATIGNIIDPFFIKHYWLDRRDEIRDMVRLGELSASEGQRAQLGLYSSAEVADEFVYGVVRPTVDDFDRHIRYPRIKKAQAAARMAIDEARRSD